MAVISSTGERREMQSVKLAYDHTSSKCPWRVLTLGCLSLNLLLSAINTVSTNSMYFDFVFPSQGDDTQENSQS